MKIVILAAQTQIRITYSCVKEITFILPIFHISVRVFWRWCLISRIYSLLYYYLLLYKDTCKYSPLENIALGLFKNVLRWCEFRNTSLLEFHRQKHRSEWNLFHFLNKSKFELKHTPISAQKVVKLLAILLLLVFCRIFHRGII